MIAAEQLKRFRHYAGIPSLGVPSRIEIRTVMAIDWPSGQVTFDSSCSSKGAPYCMCTIHEFLCWATREALPTEIAPLGLNLFPAKHP